MQHKSKTNILLVSVSTRLTLMREMLYRTPPVLDSETPGLQILAVTTGITFLKRSVWWFSHIISNLIVSFWKQMHVWEKSEEQLYLTACKGGKINRYINKVNKIKKTLLFTMVISHWILGKLNLTCEFCRMIGKICGVKLLNL